MSNIKVLDLEFVPYIDEITLANRINALAQQINNDFEGKNPLFLAILNGSFMFAADLFKAIHIPAQISFIKLASYKGTTSTGNIVTAIGLEESLKDRHVIVIEDIIDTGKTLSEFLPQLSIQGLASLEVASLLIKPAALQYDVKAKYVGFEIPNKFVVGFGLDYDGYGRNIPAIYQLK